METKDHHLRSQYRFLPLQILWSAKEKVKKHPTFKVFYVHFM